MGHQVFVYECPICNKKNVTVMGKIIKCNCKNMKKSIVEKIELHTNLHGINKYFNINFWETAKDLESKQSQEYAEFCVKCDRENLPLVNFKDWLKL